MSQSNQSPSWGAPVSGAWGSPLTNSGAGRGRNSLSNQQTPVHHDAAVPSMNRSNSYPRGGGFNSSPRGSPFGQSPSPRHFQPRPRYQSSPINNPRTPRFGSFHNSSQEFTPSPRHRGNSSFGSQRRSSYQQRDNSMNNPGGSNNIDDYIHPSMLEDPWKDLKPKPFLRQY